MAITEVAPGKEGYGRADSPYGESETEKSVDGQGYVPILPSSPLTSRSEKTLASPPSSHAAPAVVLSRTNRLEWIDGLRGIASIIIFTHHFSDLTWAQRYPNVLREGSIDGFLRFVSTSGLE